MKTLFVFAFAIIATSTFGQIPTNIISENFINANVVFATDTSLKVIYADKEINIKKPAYFLNDKFISETLLGTLSPTTIDSINIVKDNIQIDNVVYYGQIHIKTKNNYKPKIISLQEIKEKYTNLKSKSAIFMIDEVIVNANYDNYLVDENNLLTIVVDKVENTRENIHLGLIKLLTKSEENIKKLKEIRIKGTIAALTK